MRRRCAMYARFQGVHLVQPAQSAYAYVHLLNDLAWGWQIPLRDNVTSIGIVGPCGQFRRSNTSRDMFFDGMIADNYVLKYKSQFYFSFCLNTVPQRPVVANGESREHE